VPTGGLRLGQAHRGGERVPQLLSACLQGVRPWERSLYDLRHTFATLALSAGEHYMQVSRWLGHSSFVLTLTTYVEYVREDDPPPWLIRQDTAMPNRHTVQKARSLRTPRRYERAGRARTTAGGVIRGPNGTSQAIRRCGSRTGRTS
jgi:hypothetical protein